MHGVAGALEKLGAPAAGRGNGKLGDADEAAGDFGGGVAGEPAHVEIGVLGVGLVAGEKVNSDKFNLGGSNIQVKSLVTPNRIHEQQAITTTHLQRRQLNRVVMSIHFP